MRLLDRGYGHLVLPEVRSVHMKPFAPTTPFHVERNMHNYAFVAARLLQPRDAAMTLVNLAVRALIETLVPR